MDTKLELIVTVGPLKDRRFSVPADGIRLGRSSSCEISIPDPALSRNHCLFETRDGGLWVTDLASANGTIVNDVQLGPDSQRLQLGDVVLVGDSALQVVAAEGKIPDRGPVPAANPAMPVIDLGLGGEPSPGEGADAIRPQDGAPKASWTRFVLWGVAILSVILAAALIILPVSRETDPSVEELPNADMGELVSFTFEKVKADTNTIYRYALAFDGTNLCVEVDDLSSGLRVRVPSEGDLTSNQLSADARKRLVEIFSSSTNLYNLASEYVGTPSDSRSLTSLALHVVRSGRVLDVTVENAPGPEALLDVCTKLESFVEGELNLYAINMPVAKLRKLSAEARREADAKWDVRELKPGNYVEALQKYDEAINYLKTVNPKPADYEELLKRRRDAKAELDRVYNEHYGNAQQAHGTQNWKQEMYELQIILELVPDRNDARNKEAYRKMLEASAQMKAR